MKNNWILNNENYQNSIYYALTHEINKQSVRELNPLHTAWQADILTVWPTDCKKVEILTSNPWIVI